LCAGNKRKPPANLPAAVAESEFVVMKDPMLQLIQERDFAPPRLRNAAIELARSQSPDALDKAREVPDGWYRAQALAWVARFAPEDQCEAIAEEAFQSSLGCPDACNTLGSAAWPIGALVERGRKAEALDMLYRALGRESEVQPASSRSEALFLLFQAAFNLGETIRMDLYHRLAAAHDEAGFWRSRRNIEDAIRMIHRIDADLARHLIEGLTDPKAKKRTQNRLTVNYLAVPRTFCRE